MEQGLAVVEEFTAEFLTHPSVSAGHSHFFEIVGGDAGVVGGEVLALEPASRTGGVLFVVPEIVIPAFRASRRSDDEDVAVRCG